MIHMIAEFEGKKGMKKGVRKNNGYVKAAGIGAGLTYGTAGLVDGIRGLKGKRSFLDSGKGGFSGLRSHLPKEAGLIAGGAALGMGANYLHRRMKRNTV